MTAEPAIACRGAYTDEYKKTIGVDFLEKQLYVPSLGEDVRCFVWDTAGQEEFDSITKTYYRGRLLRWGIKQQGQHAAAAAQL